MDRYVKHEWKPKSRSWIIGLLSMLALGPGGLAFAQTNDDQGVIEEIVVTAQKRETALIDTPMSIGVTTGEDIEARGIDSALDLSFNVPGFTVQERRPGQQVFSIRGIGNLFGSSSLVGVYLDDVDVTGQGSLQPDLNLFDLERAEVLRGPQGTLYGAGSTGGTVRFITRKPNLEEVEGRIELSALDTHKGDFGYRVRGVANVPVAEDRFALRAAVSYHDDGGWIDQPFRGKDDENDSELVNVRLSALWQINDNFRALATAIVHRNDLGATNNSNLSLSDSEFRAFANPSTFPTDFEVENDFFGLTLTYDFDWGTLTSATGRIDVDNSSSDVRLFEFGPPIASDLGFERLQQREEETFTQELRLNSNGEGKFDWVVGAFYRDEESSSSSAGLRVVSNPFIAVPGHPFFGLEHIGLPLTQPPTAFENESWAVFANVDYRVTDRLTLGAGLRYFEDDREVLDEVSAVPVDQQGDFDDTSPRVFASYAVTEDINVYASYAQGFRSGGFNSVQLVAVGEPETYDVENVDSYEIGAKMNLLDGSLYAEVALFKSDYDDIQSVVINFAILQLVTRNLGEAEVEGVDLALLWKVTDNLTLGFNGNYTDHEFTNVPPGSAQVVGDPIDMVPDYSYSFTADYYFNWTDQNPGYFRLAYNRQDEFVFTNRNSFLVNPVDPSDKISLVNASLGFEFENGFVELFGENLGDEDGTITADKFSERETQYRPRTIGVKFGYNF